MALLDARGSTLESSGSGQRSHRPGGELIVCDGAVGPVVRENRFPSVALQHRDVIIRAERPGGLSGIARLSPNAGH